MTTPDSVTEAMKLEPCPFCGGELTAKGDEHGKYWEHLNSQCPADTFMADCDDDLAAWNRRAPTPQAVEALREAIALIEEALGRGLGDWDHEAAARLPELRAALTPSPTEKPARHDEGEGLAKLEAELERQRDRIANHEDADCEPYWSSQADLVEWLAALRSLSARNKELVEGLRPFAKVAIAFDYWVPLAMPNFQYPIEKNAAALKWAKEEAPNAFGELTEEDFRRARSLTE